MKKIVLSLVLVLFAMHSFSQLRLYTEAGINQSRPTFLGGPKIGGPSFISNASFTGSAGLIKKLSRVFQINSKISFLRKSYQVSFWVGPDYYGTNDYKVSALQLHLFVEKNISQKRKLQFFPSLGLYTTAHTKGSISYDTYNFGNTQKDKRDIRFNGDDYDMKRWDLGISAGLKTQWKKNFIHVNADAGLVKAFAGSYDKWGSLQLTVGYLLK